MNIDKYPCPDNRIEKYWNIFIEDVTHRENLKASHLQQLRVLCEIYLRHDKLSQFIDENGYTYSTESRNGLQIKEYPEVAIYKNHLSEIRQYSRMLGLQLVKDTATSKKDEGSEWR